ncbi:MAG: ice-binding family protein, partial [Nitrosotalea sp.]
MTTTRNNLKNYFVMFLLILSALSMIQNNAFATSAPNLGAAGTFGILASTYTNTVSGTTINGDLGYVTGPATAPTVTGVTHVNDATYTQAGTDQNTAISSANSQACTTNLGTTVDLSLVQGGIYTPGVYCTTGATSIGSGGITLSGNGIYIFQIGGTLGTVTGSAVNLINGAQTSSVYWVPTAATTLGASSNFVGTILDALGVTIGNTVSMTGRVLAFGGTVSTTTDTITVPPTLTISTTSGPVGQTVSVNFNNLIANHVYTIKFGSTTASGAFATGTTNSTGGASGTVTVPFGISAGSQPLSVTDGTNSPSTTFTVTAPTIDAAVPTSGPVGQTVSVNFNNLIANHVYTIK